jgi:hypothetical protein
MMCALTLLPCRRNEAAALRFCGSVRRSTPGGYRFVIPALADCSCLLTLARMKALPLLILMLLSLSACGVEQVQPAPVAADERWGHLPPDPERPEQAEQTDPGRS